MNHEKIIQEIEQLKNEIAGLKEQKGFKSYLKKAFSKTHVIVGIGCTILVTSLIVYAAQVTFTDGEVISAEQVNANFTELFDNVTSLLTKTGQHDTAIANAASIRDMSRGLIIQNNATHSDHQIDISADEVILQDSSYNPLRATGIALTADMDVLGANGRDYGAERDSTWYFIFIISNGSNNASLLSENSESPLLPSGYKYIARLGAVYNDASLNLINIYQSGKRVIRNTINVVSDQNPTTYTSINLSGVIPSTARSVFGQAFILTMGSEWGILSIAPRSTVFNDNIWISSYCGANIYVSNQYELQLIEPQMIYYKTSAVSVRCYSLKVTGWQY